MKHPLAARLLISISLTTILPLAMANQGPHPGQPSNEVILPDRSDAQPEQEPKPVMPATPSRGQMLYENHCQGCHTSVVHVREARQVRSLNDLEHWVNRWATTLKLGWRTDDIHEVVDYLNQRYYQLK